MTSQLVLGNGFGVGLASDTAVTMHGGSGGRTYETAEKIVPLPLPHRLAVMHAGSVLLHGLPFNVLLKEWIRSLGTAPESQLGSVDRYRTSFLTWLGDNLERWASSERRDREATNYLTHQLLILSDQIAKRWQEEPGRPELEVALDFIRERNAVIDEAPFLEATSPEVVERVLWRLWNGEGGTTHGLADAVEHSVRGIEQSPQLRDEVQGFLRRTIEKSAAFPSGGESELAFVGYGRADLFPSVSVLSTGGTIEGEIWRRPLWSEPTREDGDGYGLIYSQGQDDQIRLVLTGYDPDVLDAVTGAVEARYGLPPFLVEPSSEGVDPGSEASGQQPATLNEVLQDEVARLTWQEKLGPARRVIASLPNASLVGAAQSLVGVQQLAKTIMGELPTVGGEIESATITLNEGFQWVSRRGSA